MLSKAGEEIKGLVDIVVKALVDHPEEVKSTILESGGMVVVELSVAKRDMGMVIGRDGRNAESLRTLLCALSNKNRKKCVLQILDRAEPPTLPGA